MRAWEYMGKGEKVDNIRALLYRIANNLIIDYVRKKKETSLDAMQEDGFDPATDDDMAHAAERLDGAQAVQALQQLDDSHREVLVMRYVNGLEPAEIAKITGESANTVSVRLHRGLRKLRVLLR
jgi:RNA polymerase sigma-70 factor (ECF subfamily)